MLKGIVAVFTSAIMLALIAYTFAVWGEQITKKLKGIFIISFISGFILDTIGTLGMFLNIQGEAPAIHAVLGFTALAGMGIHAFWAALVWKKNDPASAHNFHRYSKYVYALWLLAFFSPVI